MLWVKFVVVVVVSLIVDVVVVLIDNRIRNQGKSVRLSDLMYRITVLNWIISGILAGVTFQTKDDPLVRVIAGVVWGIILIFVTIVAVAAIDEDQEEYNEDYDDDYDEGDDD